SRDEERHHRGDRPGSERNDQHAAQRLEVLDDRHPLLLHEHRGAPRHALEDPIQKGERPALSCWKKEPSVRNLKWSRPCCPLPSCWPRQWSCPRCSTRSWPF